MSTTQTGAGTSPEYLVTLQPDGNWKWKLIPTLFPAVAKLRNDYQNKYDPENTPSFLVDLGPDYKTLDPSLPWPWKVIAVQHLLDDDLSAAEALLNEGWGALSYAWGEYLPYLDGDKKTKKHRPVYTGSRQSNGLPLAYVPPGSSPEEVASWNWGIPQIKEIEIIGIKRVFATMKRRFIWWDMACLPQIDFSKGFDKDPSRGYNGPPRLAPTVQAASNGELTKQKFVYDRATAGAVWLLSLTWDNTDNKANWKALQKMLTQAPKLLDLATIKTMTKDQKATDPKKKAVWTILANVLGNPLLGSTGQESADAWKAAIESFRGLLNSIRNEEAYFRSLWSFQETRLMTNQAFLDRSGKVLPLYKDAALTGEQPPFPNTNISVDGVVRQATFPSMADITNFATLLASQISIAYNNVYGSGTVVAPIPPLVQLWAKPAQGVPYLEPVLQELTTSGLLYNSEQSPLELILAARRSRFPSLKFADQYFAMTGVLGLVKTATGNDFEMKTSNDYFNGVTWSDDPNVEEDWSRNAKWLTDELPKAFFEALIKRYQWLMLLLAKKPTDKVAHWGAVSMGHYETINPYFEGLFLGNEFMTSESDWSFELPHLEYSKKKDLVRIFPPIEYVSNTVVTAPTISQPVPANDKNRVVFAKPFITCWQVKEEWAADTCYLYTLDGNATDYVEDEFVKDRIKDQSFPRATKPSNKVVLKSVTSADFGGLNPNKFLLIPFKSLGFALLPNPKNAPVAGKESKRCLVIAGAARDTSDAYKYTGYFAGIADMRNIAVDQIDANHIEMKWQKPPA